MGTRACKGALKAPVCSQKPWSFNRVPAGFLIAVFFPLEKAYRSPCRQLAGHLTDTLTGHELVGKNLW